MAQSTSPDIVPPDAATGGGEPARNEFARGWPILLASVLGISLTSFPVYAAGVFMKVWETEFGWSRSDIAVALTCHSLFLSIGAPIVGRLVDSFGVRRPVLISTALIIPAFWAIATISSDKLTLYLAFSAYSLVAGATTAVPFARVISENFDRYRALALGIAISGSMISLFLAPFISYVLLAHMSWRAVWLCCSLFPALIFPILYVMLKDSTHGRPEGRSSGNTEKPVLAGLTGRETVRNPRFWLLALALLTTTLALMGILGQMIPVLGERGISIGAAVTIQSGLAIGLGLGRIMSGYIADRVFAPLVFQLLCSLAALGLLLIAIGPVTFIPAAVFFVGVALGAEVDLGAFMTSRYFGLRSYAQIYSWMYCFSAGGAMIAPIAFAQLRDLTGNYVWSLTYSIILLGIAILLIVPFGRYPEFEKPKI